MPSEVDRKTETGAKEREKLVSSAKHGRRKKSKAPDKEAPFDRHFRVLETVRSFPQGLGLTELVRVLELPKTTVHRLLQSLTRAGLLAARSPRFGPYVPGPRLLALFQPPVSDNWIESMAKPFLRELADRTGDTSFLARLDGTSIRSVGMATPENDVHVYVVPGRELSPLYAASAKAILAHQTDATIKAVYAAAHGSRSGKKPTMGAFLRELETVRTDNVAFNAGEDIAGYAAVAAPIKILEDRVQFSVAVTGTYDKLMTPQNKARLAHLTQAFARRLGDAIAIRSGQSAA